MAERCFKGKSLMFFPSDYVMTDIETTGLNPAYDNIIEISAVRVKDHKICGTFSEIINIHKRLPPFISSLTGITDSMIANGLPVQDVLSMYLNFIGNDIIMGHNVNFDINFLYDNCLGKTGTALSNDFVDTLRLSRKILPELSSHSLDSLAEYYGVKKRSQHRALGDCEMTVAVYNKLREEIKDEDGFFAKKTCARK